ncbi:MAG: hypothetical protein V4601_05455 [Pseudomonadota bacterium]
MLLRLTACLLLSAAPALAQEHQHAPDPHAGHAMDHSSHQMNATTGTLGGYPMNRDASGTAWQPDAAPHGGVHTAAGDWMLMGHLSLAGVYSNQSGPRGDDKAFAAGMAMGAARRDWGDGTLNLRLMLSPDPLMGKDGYPLLLASGETADGKRHLLDRQHPHELVMEMAASYSHRLSDSDSAFLYLGYPGEPALGPPAFMHRASAAANPSAPITHHWLDSTHITFGVATAGFVHDKWKLEASQFTGREPDQFRFNFDKPKFDSTAVRLSFNPDQHWSLQASWGHLNSPEQLDPTKNEDRFTASAQYFAQLEGQQSFAFTAAWGLKRLSDGNNLHAAVLEATYKPSHPWSVFARGEWVENAELGAHHEVNRVGQLTLGAVHDWRLSENWKLGLGASHSFAFAPAALGYGGTPRGNMVFARIVAE